MKAPAHLRIAMMLESDGPGGAETMVFRLSEQLRERGHTVVPVGLANGIGWLGDLYRNSGVAPELFPMRAAVDLNALAKLVRLLRQHRINAVHSHEFTMAVYGAAACRLLRVPQVITMHGGLRAFKALRRRVALRWAMRNSAHTVTVSHATRRVFAASLGIDERRFTVIPNGVPNQAGNATRVREEFGIQPGECILLAVGTLERHKGHRVLLDALARLASGNLRPSWKLIIAGGRGGDQHDGLLQFLEEEGLDDHVRIVTNRNDIPDLLALADLFVMPSLQEGLPMALLEAMTAGKAIIASSTSGIPEAIVDGRDGILVPPGDVSSLAEALKSLITDSARRNALGTAAAARAHAEFTARAMSERYEALYSAESRPGRLPRTRGRIAAL